MERTAEKLFVMGIDGMDPRLTVKYVEKGLMPNMKKFIEWGACREDLVMLGGHPTVTPPMWTTLATGAYPCTHGITAFSRPSDTVPGAFVYNLDSRNCKAEPLWNVTAESGLKTLVFHWPGSSWPPTSDSPDLHVVDGTQPPAVNMGVAMVEHELIIVASDKTEAVHFRQKATSDTNVPCVITDLKPTSDLDDLVSVGMGEPEVRLILSEKDTQGMLSDAPFDVVLSPIRPASNWGFDVPKDAYEFTLLFSQGVIRRVGLILANEAGVYDHIAIHKNKKTEEPIVVLAKDVLTIEVIDEAIKDETTYEVNRNMRLLELAEDGQYLKLWISGAMDIHNDTLWHPKRLYEDVVSVAGHPSPEVMLGGKDKILIRDCMAACWEVMAQWQAKAIRHLMEAEQYKVVFSHFHNIDAQGHMIMKYLKGNDKLSAADYEQILEECYEQTDRYIGEFLPLLDEGWTIFLVSDHAQVCPEHQPPFICDGSGIDVRVMEELGFTVLKEKADGGYELDWSKTRAIASGMNIYLNIKGRDKYGIVEPEDQYELEEEIMTALYGYHDKTTGHRIIALALRNKDAILLGLGGPESGDIIIALAEGYNYDHADSLSTTYGAADTSVSPIFVAAGQGIKENFKTERIIREVDLTPTMAVLAGVRMPAQCEGAPVYQILAKER